jgi:hypothetical protein
VVGHKAIRRKLVDFITSSKDQKYGEGK